MLRMTKRFWRRFHDDFRRVYSRYAGPDKFNPDCGPINGKTKSIFGIEREGIGYGQAAAHPLANAEIEEIHTYAWPSPDWFDVSHIREDALAWKNQYAVLGGEWCPIFHDAIDLLGMENMLILMYEDPDIVHAVLSHITDFYYELSAREFEAAQGAIDIFFIGNDLGSQTGTSAGRRIVPQISISLFEAAGGSWQGIRTSYDDALLRQLCPAYAGAN